MKQQLSWILCISFCTFAQLPDSSDIVFGDTKINTFYLEFYVDGWEDSLKNNYEVLDEEYMPAKVTYGNLVLDSIGIRYKGNSSYRSIPDNNPKKPYKIKFNEYREDQRFFGLKKLNFGNGYKDPSFLRETIGYHISREYLKSPRTAFANIYINGTLIGLYTQVEQIDKTFLKRHFGDNDFNLYKAASGGGDLTYRGIDQALYYSEYELKTNEEENDWSGFISMIEKLNNTPTSLFIDTMNPILNINNCLQYFAFNMVLSNFDSYTGSGQNHYWYDDSISGHFYIMPWDLNECFGVFSNDMNVITQDIITLSNLNNKPLIKKTMENDSLKQIYLGYIKDLIEGPASYDSVAVLSDLLAPVIEEHVLADPNKLSSYKDFLNNINSQVGNSPGIKSFSRQRNENLQMQLAQYTSVKYVTKKINLVSKYALKCFSRGATISIEYSIDIDNCPVTVNIYSCDGSLIKSIYKGINHRGVYTINWAIKNNSFGAYVINVKTNKVSLSKKVLIID